MSKNYDMTAAEFQAHMKQKKQPKGKANKDAGDPAKAEMEMILKLYGLEYKHELVFHPERKWRFDFAIPSLMISIEYEGLFSEKSGHTTINGFIKDCEKYREAAKLGWKVLRYTQKDYKRLYTDLQEITGARIPDKIDCKQLKENIMEKLPKNFDKNSDGWVKCSEMLPNESRLYLTFFDGRVDIQYYKSESKRFNHPYLETITTTHWRELPAPPKD